MRIKNLPKWEKPREKLLKNGAESLSTAEILAIILRTGTREKTALELATELLMMDEGGIRYLLECAPEDLKKLKGMGDAKICEVLAAIELGKRLASLPAAERQMIRCSDDIAGLFMEKLRYEKREHFICLQVNTAGEIIGENEISIGDLSSAQSHPREVFVNAVKKSAGSVAFVHNHPSGNPSPSPEDIKTTKRLMSVGELLGIPVIDHVIIGDGRFSSMKGMGLL